MKTKTLPLKQISNHFTMFTLKNISFFIGGILIIIGGLGLIRYQTYTKNLQTEQDMMYHVTTGNIEVQVKINAKASLVDEQKLSFGKEGKIVSVKVDVGDEVKAGDILAELDLKDYHDAVKSAELELENARLGLSKLVNNDTSLAEAKVRSQIKEAKLSLEVESDQYNILKKQLETALQQKKDQFKQISNEYFLAKKKLDIEGSGATLTDEIFHASANNTADSIQDHQQKINNIVSDLEATLGDMENVIETVDKIFGVTSSNEIKELSANNTSLKLQTQTKVFESYSFLRKFETKIDGITNDISDNEIYKLIQEFYNESTILLKLCDTALDALDKSIITSNVTETILQGYITKVSTARTTIIGIRSTLKTLKDSVNTILSSYEEKKVSLQSQSNTITLLAKEISTAENNNQNQLARKQAEIENIKEKIGVLNKELNDVLDGVDAYDIKQQNNLVDLAELQRKRIQQQQDDYQIIAEFDGRVRAVDIGEGEQYKLDDKKYIVVENPNIIELELQVNQIDIVKIKEGQPVIIKFDAYPTVPINATITSRNVNPEPNQRGGIYYKATITLEKPDIEILAGMSAIVTVTVAETKSVIVIPTLALIQKDDKTYVHLRKENGYILHEIEVGITNNFQAEITSGLQKGDIILASVLDEKTLEEMGIDGNGFPISFFK